MKMLSYGLIGGVVGLIVCGVVGFCIGFLGPMVFYPESNIGPIMGFVTGPIGIGVGLIVGACVGVVLGSKAGRRGAA